MIRTEDIRVTFGGVVAIDRLTMDYDGSICGLIGPNGAGKTTLLNVLSGFVTPTSGSLFVDGADQAGRGPALRAKSGIRRTFQTDLVVDELTVWDNVLIAAEHTGGRGAASDVNAVLQLVGLDAHRDRRVGSLDTFERRLVEVARGSVGRPTHILMDEPGGGLGASESARLAELIISIRDELDAQIVLVDHDVELIAATCDQTACLDFGQLIAHGPTAAVLASDEVKAAYLGSIDSGEETV